MTFTQIKYFVEAAKCLNFTQAAKRLHITQPTLSKQITVIERETNMILFFREAKALRLTPCGEIFYKEVSELLNQYEEILLKAQNANSGLNGSVKIGVLEGHDVSQALPKAIKDFENQYPNIKLYMERFSFRQLLEAIYSNELDAIITYDFEVEDKEELDSITIEECSPVVAISKSNPLSEKMDLRVSDLCMEEFAIVNSDECENGVNIVKRDLNKYGGFTPRFYIVDTMESAILWVEGGGKCGLFNTGMSIINSKHIRAVYMPGFPTMEIKLAWKKNSNNQALQLFVEKFKKD